MDFIQKNNKNIPKHVHGSQKLNSIYFSKATSSLPILPTFFVPFRIPDIHPSPLGSWGVTSLAQASAKATDQCCKSWSWNQHSWLEKSHNFEEKWRDYPWCFFESLPAEGWGGDYDYLEKLCGWIEHEFRKRTCYKVCYQRDHIDNVDCDLEKTKNYGGLCVIFGGALHGYSWMLGTMMGRQCQCVQMILLIRTPSEKTLHTWFEKHISKRHPRLEHVRSWTLYCT